MAYWLSVRAANRLCISRMTERGLVVFCYLIPPLPEKVKTHRGQKPTALKANTSTTNVEKH